MTLDRLILLGILPFLGLGMVLAFARLALGPDLPDRVVALDLITALIICITAGFAVATDQPAYLDAAIVLALVAFLGTVACAYYLHRRKEDAPDLDHDSSR